MLVDNENLLQLLRLHLVAFTSYDKFRLHHSYFASFIVFCCYLILIIGYVVYWSVATYRPNLSAYFIG